MDFETSWLMRAYAAFLQQPFFVHDLLWRLSVGNQGLPGVGFVCLLFIPGISRPVPSARSAGRGTKSTSDDVGVAAPGVAQPLPLWAQSPSLHHQTSSMAQHLQDLPAAMAVVPQRAAYVRLATKADIPAILNIVYLNDNKWNNLPDTLPPTSTLAKNHPSYRQWRKCLVKAITVPNEVLVVLEMDSPTRLESNQGVISGTNKAILGYARGLIVLPPGHQPITRGVWTASNWRNGSYPDPENILDEGNTSP